MQLVRAVGAFGHRAKQLFGGVLGVARHEADAVVARDRVHQADQVCEVHAAAEIFSVGVHILAEEGDVLISGGNELARLGHDVLRPARALASAHVGHHAVGAEIVAAVHDRQPGLHVSVAAAGDALGHDAVVLLGGEYALVREHDPLQQLREAPELMRPEDEIHHRVGALDLLRHVLLLHHAAADRDDLPRAGLFAVVERADVAEHAHLGVLAHGAGIHHDHVRLELVRRKAVAHLLQIAAQLFAVGLVLLAAVGVHHGKRRGAVGGNAAADAQADRLLAADLLRGDLFSLIAHSALFSLSLHGIFIHGILPQKVWNFQPKSCII